MSGIAGIIHFDGQPVGVGEVEGMTTAMAYRGPDGISHWRQGSVALGQCMLRTTPESMEETQPFANEDESLVLVMDGRVDNWEELRRELLGKGAQLHTRSDVELVLRAYEQWGRECLLHLEGDFAFVIWDARRQKAFCVRDRVGSRRFHYHWNGQTLVFATDINAILSLPWFPEVMDQGVLADTLALETHSLDETLWQGILRLLPAHYLLVGAEGRQANRYWFPDLHATLPCRSDGEYIEHYRALFSDVVRRMSRSSHPLACDVSGGLDSSAIFGVAERLRQTGQLLAPGLDGYVLDFSGDLYADELKYSRAVGSHLGRLIHEIAPAHMSLEWHKDYAQRYRELPELPNLSMGRTIASAARAHGCRVTIKGLGGDEWLQGFAGYPEALADGEGRALLDYLRTDIAETGLGAALWQLLRHGLVPLLPEPVRQVLRTIAGASPVGPADADPNWLSPVVLERLANRRRQHAQAESIPCGRRSQQRQVGFLMGGKFLFGEVVELQCATLGLELRRPFWDARLIQSAFATPQYMLRRGKENKWLHRQSMVGFLPEAVLRRTGKAEFSVAYARYWGDLSRCVLDEVLPQRQAWLRRSEVEVMIPPDLQDDARRKMYHLNSILWTLFGVDAIVRACSAPS